MNQYTLIFTALDNDLYSNFAREYTNENAGIDLFCTEEVDILPGQMVLLKLGLSAKMVRRDIDDSDCHYWLLPRSSISKKGLMMANSVGVIDRTYRGQLMGAVRNVSGDIVKVVRGERLFQIVAPDMGHISECIQSMSLDETTRGAGGFGSTGI